MLERWKWSDLGDRAFFSQGILSDSQF